jgi:hypothetical protein
MGTARIWWKRAASVGSVAVLTLALVVLAVVQKGFAVTELDLDDSGVWVTNQSRLTVGRFNYNAGQLDGSLVAPTDSAFDVLQNEGMVLINDLAQNQVTPINTARLQPAAPIALGVGTQISLGGGASLPLPPHRVTCGSCLTQR